MRYILAFILFSAFIFLVSCDNTLDIVEESGDIPVVYGFLSGSDTIQLIRVERAFIDKNTSGLELAQDPNNFFYDESTTVSLVNMDTQEEFALTRVDGNEIGYVRDEGVFANKPNYLYSLDTEELNIDPDNTETVYELQIQRPGDLPLVTARTLLVGESRIRRPLESNPTIDFGNYINPVLFIWRKGSNAKIYDINLRFNYQERVANSGDDWINKSATWVVAQNIEDPDNSTESTLEYSERAEQFYNFVANAIPVDETLIRRAIDVDVQIIGAGGGVNEADQVDIVEYIRVEGANLGITSTQVVPSVTNLSEGRGILGSIYTTSLESVRLTDLSRDSLINGERTRNLNFQ